jgi:hypothetical protein
MNTVFALTTYMLDAVARDSSEVRVENRVRARIMLQAGARRVDVAVVPEYDSNEKEIVASK